MCRIPAPGGAYTGSRVCNAKMVLGRQGDMFVITLSRTSLKKLGLGAMCCALVVCSALLGRYISTRTVTAAASVNKIESAQDIQTLSLIHI